jgi:hypothetical protein
MRLEANYQHLLEGLHKQDLHKNKGPETVGEASSIKSFQ